MTKPPDEGSFGTPDIDLQGFRLWVHSRQFPASHDYWDGNWLVVTACCKASGATVWAEERAILMVTEIARWADECEVLHTTLKGEASLSPIEPDLLVVIRATDSLGHLEMRVEINSDYDFQDHVFISMIDQSHLAGLVRQCRAIVENYPIRGERP